MSKSSAGVVQNWARQGFGLRCPSCGGTGGVAGSTCPACGGSGSNMLALGLNNDGSSIDGQDMSLISTLVNPGNSSYRPGPNPANWSAAEAGFGTRESQPNGSVHPMTVGSRSGLDRFGAGPNSPMSDWRGPRPSASQTV